MGKYRKNLLLPVNPWLDCAGSLRSETNARDSPHPSPVIQPAHINRVQLSYDALINNLDQQHDMHGEYLLGVMALVPHAAYHLGVIRLVIERSLGNDGKQSILD